jgi:hypothetical protein
VRVRERGARGRIVWRQCRAARLRQSVYSVTRFPHTPSQAIRIGALLLLSVPATLAAQAPAQTGGLLDALSLSVKTDTTTVARGTIRYRMARTGAELEMIATGIIVGGGSRVTAEFRTDTAGALRRYVAEVRDSTGRVVDRTQITSLGNRVTLERVTPARRLVREFFVPRDVMILDVAAVVPFVAIAARSGRATQMTILDVRRLTAETGSISADAVSDILIDDTRLRGTLMTFRGLTFPLRIWSDARGRLLRIAYGASFVTVRDDVPI